MNRYLLVLSVLLAMVCCVSAQSNFDLAFQHLQSSGKYQSADLNDLRISDEYESKHNGISHLYLQQRYNGIDIKYALTNFNIKSDAITYAAGAFVENVQDKINTVQAQLTASQALQVVLGAHSLNAGIPQIQEVSSSAERKTIFEKGELADQEIEVKLVYLALEDQLRLCWEVSLYEKSCNHWWEALVDAQSGEIVHENDQVLHCSFHRGNTSHRHHENIPARAQIKLLRNASVVANSYNVYAYPVESPNHGDRTLQTSPWNQAGDAGTLGWHDDGTNTYTHTRGNNVDAYEDQNNSNAPSGGNAARADGGDDLEFDFPIDLTIDPELDPDPYITNLFYWNNLMHDVWYHYGFDEVSGNFQEDNLGRGGSGSDYVRAEAQDGGGTNNANFATPSEGNNPRMQMYLWSPTNTEFLEVNAPDNVAGTYEMRPASFGGSLDTPIIGDVVEVDDGSANPSLGCDPLENGGELSGNIALIDRGDCQFGLKCLNAQNAGAIAVIVCNNVSGLVTMAPGNDGDQVTIPAVMIRQGDCSTLRAELNEGLNVTMEVSGENPPIDGDLDNGIIAHEYGHGISIRLTGGPSSSSCLNNAEQMGEGWSDFFGIWMTIENGDEHFDVRGVGTYAIGQSTTGNGIRPAPYTTDLTINDYTYGNVDDGNISRPHGIGFIWCTMLWDLNWALINEHGFDPNIYNGAGGNNIAAQLVMDGLKNQPCSPGFVDGRDAILEADETNNGNANEDIIWNVFARRGLGYSADQGSSSNRSDQTQAFDLPPGIPFIPDEELFGSIPLPVELLGFNAFPNEEKRSIDLFWTTVAEIDNRGFELQRRTEDSNLFETISWTDARGDTNVETSYTFSDNNVKPNTNYYYRLRQVDNDGKENYSDVVTAMLNEMSDEILVFPNPTDGLSTIQLPEQITGTVNLTILNVQGQVIGSKLFETSGAAALSVDLSQHAKGVYFLKFEYDNQQVIRQLIID